MTEFWTQIEGEAISPQYRLGARLEETADGAVYLTDDNAIVKLHHAGSPDADALLERWSGIARLSHPHLAQILAAGRCELNGEPFVFAVMERAEETLAGVLSDRALSPDEVIEMLNPALDALCYIHENGYVHGSFQPSNILALGETLKLSSDTIMPAGEEPKPHPRRPYDAPEMDAGVLVPASDAWSLGATTLEALTQGFRHDEDVLHSLPQPFSDIVRHAMKEAPEERWTIRQIAARLRQPAVTVHRERPEPAREQAPGMVERPPAARPETHKWPLAAGAIALLGIAIFFVSRKPEPVPGPTPAPVAQVTAMPVPAIPQPALAPVPTRTGTWCVVVATYNQRSGAEKRAGEMSRRWPRFKVTVFEQPDGKRHLVVLGSGLSQTEADAIRKRALAAGLPRDVFIVKIPR